MAQALDMKRTTETVWTLAAAPADSLAHFLQRREVGWILRHGGCRGIERQSAEVRSRVAGG